MAHVSEKAATEASTSHDMREFRGITSMASTLEDYLSPHPTEDFTVLNASKSFLHPLTRRVFLLIGIFTIYADDCIGRGLEFIDEFIYWEKTFDEVCPDSAIAIACDTWKKVNSGHGNASATDLQLALKRRLEILTRPAKYRPVLRSNAKMLVLKKLTQLALFCLLRVKTLVLSLFAPIFFFYNLVKTVCAYFFSLLLIALVHIFGNLEAIPLKGFLTKYAQSAAFAGTQVFLRALAICSYFFSISKSHNTEKGSYKLPWAYSAYPKPSKHLYGSLINTLSVLRYSIADTIAQLLTNVFFVDEQFADERSEGSTIDTGSLECEGSASAEAKPHTLNQQRNEI